MGTSKRRIKASLFVSTTLSALAWVALTLNISTLKGQTTSIHSDRGSRSAYDTYAASTPATEAEVTAAQRAFSDGDYKRAAKRLRAAIAAEPNNSGLLDEMGVIYQRLAESSAFPSLNQRRAESYFRKSIAADKHDPRPLEHLISMMLDPPNRCRGNLNEATKLIQQLALIDPVSARAASQSLEWVSSEPTTLAEKVSCAPHDAMAVVHRIMQ